MLQVLENGTCVKVLVGQHFLVSDHSAASVINCTTSVCSTCIANDDQNLIFLYEICAFEEFLQVPYAYCGSGTEETPNDLDTLHINGVIVWGRSFLEAYKSYGNRQENYWKFSSKNHIISLVI